MSATVISVAKHHAHEFSKLSVPSIKLVTGLGVDGDAHSGVTVKHRSRVARDPTQPNLRQVHLIHAELIDELIDAGFKVSPGAMGENITTRGLDLLALPRGARLKIGQDAIVEITGLRNPCVQLNHFQDGLMDAVLGRTSDGRLIRKSGIMAIVIADGMVSPGDAIDVTLPPSPHVPLEPV
jgi:MOSC domain-containing protein YiiM